MAWEKPVDEREYTNIFVRRFPLTVFFVKMNADGCLLSLRIWIVQPRMWLNSGPSTVALCWHGIWVTSRSFLKQIWNIVCML